MHYQFYAIVIMHISAVTKAPVIHENQEILHEIFSEITKS